MRETAMPTLNSLVAAYNLLDPQLIEKLNQADIGLIMKSDLQAIMDKVARQEEEIKALEFRIATLLRA